MHREKISKTKEQELFEKGLLEQFGAGAAHKVNIPKGNFTFAPVMYLHSALDDISKMPQSADEITAKYAEMNGANPS